jgi:hypothetical protein
VSHARVAIIADRIVVRRTGRTVHTGRGRGAADVVGAGAGSPRPSRCAPPADGGPHRSDLRGGSRLALLHSDRRVGR